VAKPVEISLWTTILLFASALSLITFYEVSGQYVGPDGLLYEEFWALALGVVSFFLGTISGLLFIVLSLVLRTPRKA
jgi:hypothetical protein